MTRNLTLAALAAVVAFAAMPAQAGGYRPYIDPYDPYYRGPAGLAVQIQPQQPLTPSRHCRTVVTEVVDPYTGRIVYEKRRVCPPLRY